MIHFFFLELKKAGVLLPVNTYINDILQNYFQACSRREKVVCPHVPLDKCISCKQTLEIRRCLEVSPLKKTCWLSQQGRGDEKRAEEAGQGQSISLLLLSEEGCPGFGWGCLGSFKGSQGEELPLPYSKTSCWFSEELPKGHTHTYPFEKNQVKLSSYLLQVKIKYIPSCFQKALGHYS